MGTAENGGVDFEIGDIGTSAHLYWRLGKTSYRACLLFYYSFGDKKIAFKSPFDLYFHPFNIGLFSVAELLFKIEEKIHIKPVMLSMLLEVLREGFLGFPGRDWGGVCGKLLSLLKLYQRFWTRNIDHNVNMALLIVAVCIVLFFYTVFMKKELTSQSICNFSFKMLKIRFSRFQNV